MTAPNGQCAIRDCEIIPRYRLCTSHYAEAGRAVTTLKEKPSALLIRQVAAQEREKHGHLGSDALCPGEPCSMLWKLAARVERANGER